MILDLDDCEKLKYAILVQAVKDYKNILMSKSREKRALAEEEIVRFFNSEWFRLLYNCDGEYIMRVVEKRAEECKRDHKPFVVMESFTGKAKPLEFSFLKYQNETCEPVSLEL